MKDVSMSTETEIPFQRIEIHDIYGTTLIVLLVRAHIFTSLSLGVRSIKPSHMHILADVL